ncbi:polysaccharide pyruvyl transferase family protein [Henriciella sp. AS95]|uniref:polysaccharide pyruvyl transferase family protein n=1 Tax=Henriciella sp. AS95 TaxID=3135782 RepID=UPI003178CB64
MKVVLLNVKYSNNLGDGIIAECFEHALRRSGQKLTVESCDLAGRTGYGVESGGLRSVALEILNMLPAAMRRPALASMVRYQVKAKGLGEYRRRLSDADVVIIGGGQLIADAGLNFPLKISAAVELGRRNGARIAIFGAGVGHLVSEKGIELFREAFDDGLELVGLRDDLSIARWRAVFEEPTPYRVRDPGLLVSDLYPVAKVNGSSKPRIGVGVTDPRVLRLHSDADDAWCENPDWIGLYAQFVTSLIEEGFDVSLFSNGAPDDQAFALRVMKRVEAQHQSRKSISLMDRPVVPQQLAEMIAGFDAIVAHRLHANIIAYSYGVPHVGLSWDHKVNEFFKAVDRSEFLIGPRELMWSGKATDLVGRALREGIDPDGVSRAKRDALNDIERMCARLCTGKSRSAHDLVDADSRGLGVSPIL